MIPRKELHPNSWNINKMNAFQYAKLLESIREYGFIDPILARPCAEHMDFEIVGGKHRWQASGDLNVPVLPVIVRQMTDPIARKISLIDNELHGQADPIGLQELLKELSVEMSPSELLEGLPFTDEILAGFLGAPLDSTGPAPLPNLPEVSPPPAGGERWVEKTYRMPASVAQVVDDAINLARDGEQIDDWQALERVAAEFLAG